MPNANNDPILSNREEFEKAEEYFTLEGFSKTEARIFSGISPKTRPRILDVGCGCGRTTIELKKLGFDVTAFDVAKSLVDYGNKKNPSLGILHLDAQNIEKTFNGSGFDVVLFSYNGLDCIYPKTKREDVIRQIYSVLRPGGIFIFQSHNSWYKWKAGPAWRPYKEDVDFFEETSGSRNMTLVMYYANPMEQKRVLLKMGFSKVVVRGFVPYLHLLNWVLDYAPIYIATK